MFLAMALMLLTAAWSLQIAKGFGQTPPVSTSANYPAPGHVYQFEFGKLAFRNEYSSDRKQMTSTRLSDGRTGTVQYTAVEIRPNLFWNYWVESDGTSVARVEDFERGTVHAMVHFPDGKVVNLSGTLRKLQ
jgi:hypothetical protein